MEHAYPITHFPMNQYRYFLGQLQFPVIIGDTSPISQPVPLREIKIKKTILILHIEENKSILHKGRLAPLMETAMTWRSPSVEMRSLASLVRPLYLSSNPLPLNRPVSHGTDH